MTYNELAKLAGCALSDVLIFYGIIDGVISAKTYLKIMRTVGDMDVDNSRRVCG